MRWRGAGSKRLCGDAEKAGSAVTDSRNRQTGAASHTDRRRQTAPAFVLVILVLRHP